MDAFGYFVSVLLAVLAILCALVFRQRDKEKSKKDMIQSLLTDLNSHDKLYKKGMEFRTRYRIKAFWDSLPTNGFKGVVSSDRYDLLTPETQEIFTEYYDMVQDMNERVKIVKAEEITLIRQKIGNEQNGILNNLRRISPVLRSLLESE